MIDFSGISLPFNVGDLISSGNGLLALVGAFVLLALAFNFVPPIIKIIVGNFQHNREYSDVPKYQVKWYSGIEDVVKEKTIYRNK